MTKGHCQCTCGMVGCASARPQFVPEHGTWTAYEHWGCRCAECKAASAERTRRRNDSSRAAASKSGQEWTSAELEVVMRADLTLAEIAGRLGRSRSAVKHARYRCQHDPKFMSLLGAGRGDEAR